MSRVSMFNSPLLLGFDQLERTLDRDQVPVDAVVDLIHDDQVVGAGLKHLLQLVHFSVQYRADR